MAVWLLVGIMVAIVMLTGVIWFSVRRYCKAVCKHHFMWITKNGDGSHLYKCVACRLEKKVW